MKPGGRHVKVYPCVGPETEKELHASLSKIDPNFNKELYKAKDLKKMPGMMLWMDIHCLITPYSISIQRCDNERCCGEFCSPVENGVRDLIMQRQPTPRIDTTHKNRMNQFLRRDEALLLIGDNEKALNDLSDLPSKKTADKEAAEEKKKRGGRDFDINKKLKLKSWDPKKVRGAVVCYFCAKPRCIFACEKQSDEYRNAAKAWQQKLESIGERYLCGDLVFNDNEPTTMIITQRQQLTCQSRIETAYYNCIDRAVKLDDICIHCGNGGSSDYLLRQSELLKLNKTGGKECYPICKPCLEEGKRVVVYPKKKTKQTQKRKEDTENKAAAKKSKKK